MYEYITLKCGFYSTSLYGITFEKSPKCWTQIPTKQLWPCLTLVDFQLDAQNYYLFIYNTFIKTLYMFRALPCSSSGGLRRNCIYAASGIVTLCRWLSCAPVKKEGSSFLTGAQDSHLQTVPIPKAACIQLRRRPPEDEQGNARNM